MGKRKLGNIIKRKILPNIPKIKFGSEKTSFSRWAGKQFETTARLKQDILLMRMS